MAPRQQQTRPFNLAPGEFQSTGRDASLALSRRMQDLVREHPDFEVLREPDTDHYSFRYVPNGLADHQAEPGVRALLDRLNVEIVEAVRRGGLTLLTAPRVGGRAAIRASVCSHTTSEGDVDAAFEAVARWGRRLTKAYPVWHEKHAETEA